MHGVPQDLDLTTFHGAELTQVCLGQYQLQFRFHPVGAISVEGKWELRDSTGARLDGQHDGPDRPPYQLHRLLGRKVVGSEVCPPESCALRFEGGDVLRLFDSSADYESFEVNGFVV